MTIDLAEEVADHLGAFQEEVVLPFLIHGDVHLNRLLQYFGGEERLEGLARKEGDDVANVVGR